MKIYLLYDKFINLVDFNARARAHTHTHTQFE